MGEHDFVGEKRGPFKGSGAVGVRAADEMEVGPWTFARHGLDHLHAAALVQVPDKPDPQAAVGVRQPNRGDVLRHGVGAVVRGDDAVGAL